VIPPCIRSWRHLPAVAAWLWATAVAPVASGLEPVAARLELVDGRTVRGTLLAIEDDAVRLVEDAGEQRFPLLQIRRLIREHDDARNQARRVIVTTRDGGRLTGDSFRQSGLQGLIAFDEGQIELPADRVARVTWLADDEPDSPWLDGVPAEPAADLVIIRQDEGHTFVECAVSEVGPETVTVVLDGDTIPVRLNKVAGIVWLREAVPPTTGAAVRLDGGTLTASSIRWSPEAFLLDGTVGLPPALLHEIDYAAGRTLPLADLEPETVTVAPFFGSLAAINGLGGFFAPRVIRTPDPAAPDTLILRPRTVATWRVPADGRRFRGQLTRDVGETAPATVEVSIAVDGREAFRQRLDATPAARGGAGPPLIDIDVSGGRRLTLTVDFGGQDLGCGVRLMGAAFEQ
jgi:hypothetical protein